jgi:hypothetical protein
MRLGEALYLEADCVEPSMYDNLLQLRYTPHKVVEARRKAGLEDCHRVLIPLWLAEEIRAYAGQSEDLRQKTGLPYLFLSRKRGKEGSVISPLYFGNAVNGLLKKYNICSDGEEAWHFTSRQCRKTRAVTLIENGATTAELSYWLGHLSSETSRKFYAEVRKMKLAELNTEFFRKRFELNILPEQLTRFSADERKLLYIDFRLGRRRVEFGFCLLSSSSGGCDRRSNLHGCVNCRHLCTGRQYLPYWQELLNDHERYLSELERSYEATGVANYSDFREYRQAKMLSDGYMSVVTSILEGGWD